MRFKSHLVIVTTFIFKDCSMIFSSYFEPVSDWYVHWFYADNFRSIIASELNILTEIDKKIPISFIIEYYSYYLLSILLSTIIDISCNRNYKELGILKNANICTKLTNKVDWSPLVRNKKCFIKLKSVNISTVIKWL